MTKPELVAAVAEKAGLSKKDSEKAINAFLDVVKEELVKGEKVQLIGFGTFEVAKVAERTGKIQMGDRKGETYVTPAHLSPKFKPGKALKDILNA